jgi:NAD(P)-dependent dehydrogenase (short-subunit alcohol dehydrogenase family)
MRIRQLMDLHGRRVLITGATGGLGRMMADTLGELGADLVLVDRPGSDFGPLKKQLEDSWKVRVTHRHCDLEQEGDRYALMAWVRDELKFLDVLINNAAFVGASELKGWATSFDLQSVDTWRRALEVNLTAVFSLTQGLRGTLEAARNPSIINIASIYGVLGPDWQLYAGTAMGNPAAYAASKGGLIQFTRWLATTLAPRIRVNAISPGGVFRGQPKTFVERYEAGTPLGRMAIEDDFKGAVAFLATNLSSYVTGHNLIVDGGRSAI